MNAALRTKGCMHPEAGVSCTGPVVRAHTVRRSADLRRIARHGHVYQASAEIGDLSKADGRIVPTLIGINEASTFWGFCQAHDASTFVVLESQTFTGTDEQAFLLAYRPLCKELYLKKRQQESLDLARQGDRGRSRDRQAQLQEFVFLMGVGIAATIRDLEAHKAEYDRELLAGDFTAIRYAIVYFDRVPDVLCTAVLQPHLTFDGQRIQDLGAVDKRLQLMAVSVIATEVGGAAVFSWRADSDVASSALVDSLLALGVEQLPHAILRYLVSEIENTYFKPEWWEALSSEHQETLLRRIQHNVGPENEVTTDYLVDDGLRLVNWEVTRIDQKRT